MILKAERLYINTNKIYNIHLEFEGTHFRGNSLITLHQIWVEYNVGSFPNYKKTNLTYYSMEDFLSDWIPISIHDFSPAEEFHYKLQINHIYSVIRDNKLKKVLS